MIWSLNWYARFTVVFDYTQVLLWDWRNNKQIACLEDSHMDDVTQVCSVWITRDEILYLSLKLDLMDL